MDQGTQQNAAMVGQATASAAQLKREAIELGELMSQFDVGEAQAARPPAGPPSGDAAGPQRRLRTAVGGEPEWIEF